MTNSFAAHLLCSTSNTSPVLCSQPTDISKEGKVVMPVRADNLLLGSGFSSHTEETHFPLSATLQLNCDLATFTTEQLTSIAQAELNRHNSSYFRSYSLDSDTRLAVLASDPKKLRDFITIYGGVLEITPLLLHGYEDGFIRAQEIEISASRSELQIDYTRKSPINKSKCTYCGICGSVCPEECLSENLFLDFGRCTHCMECVNACSQGAIDLYGAEKHSMKVPALLLLDGTAGVDLPLNKNNIYNPATLDTYFSSIFPSQVDEVVTCNNSICQYSGRLNSGCNRCLSACQHGAVHQNNEGVFIEQLLCQECGECIASCPTGALQYQRFTDLQFIEYFQTFRPAPPINVVIGSEESLHSFWWQNGKQRFEQVFFLEHPKVQALTSMHLLYLFSLGAVKVVLLDEGIGVEQPWQEQIRQTNQIINALFKLPETVVISTVKELAKHLKRQAAHPLTSFNLNDDFQNRRLQLTSTLKFLVEASANNTVLTGADLSTFGTLDCDQQRCTQCLACLNECKVQALRGDENTYSLEHLADRCVQCGICVKVCPEDALSLAGGLQLRPDFFREQTLSVGEAMSCKACGKIFGTRKSFERVMAKLNEKDMRPGPDNIFEYCDKCRIIVIYESREENANAHRNDQ